MPLVRPRTNNFSASLCTAFTRTHADCKVNLSEARLIEFAEEENKSAMRA
jgi:hypothetical protein